MISIAGLAILFYLIFNYNKYSTKICLIKNLSFLFFISINLQYGVFINSDFIVIQYWQFALIVSFLLIFPDIHNKKIQPSTFFVVIFLLFLLFKLLFFPLQENIVVGFEKSYEAALGDINYFQPPILTKFTLFITGLAILNVLVASFFNNQISSFEQAQLISNYSRYTRYYFVLVVVEVLIKFFSFEENYYNLIKNIFGFTESSLGEVEIRNGLPMIHGFMREGSHFAYSVSFSIILLYADLKINNEKKNFIYILIGLILLLVSMSLSVVVMILILLTVWFIDNGMNKFLLSFLFFSFIIYLVNNVIFPSELANYYLIRLNEFIDDLMFIKDYRPFQDTFEILSSAMSRMATIYNNFYVLKYAPFFGTGIATNSSHSSLSLLISETGIIGTIVFLLYFIKQAAPKFGKFTYYLSNTIWLIGVLFIPIAQANLIVRVDLILMPIVLSLLIKNRNDKVL